MLRRGGHEFKITILKRHRHQNFGFTFKNYYDSEILEGKDAWLKQMAFATTLGPGKLTNETRDLVEQNLRGMIQVGCFAICTTISTIHQFNKEAAFLEGAGIESFLAQPKSTPTESQSQEDTEEAPHP